MTKLKIGGLSTSAAEALDPHIRALYDRPGGTALAVVEFEHVERTQPGPRSESEPSVKVRVSLLEVPVGEAANSVREVMRSLFLIRTARGTLDGDGEVELAEQTLRLAAGEVSLVEAARCRGALRSVGDMARRARTNDKATEGTMTADLRSIEQAVDRFLTGPLQPEQG